MKNASPVKSSQNLAFGLFYAFKIIPLIISGMAIYLGYRLFVLGVSGQASLSIDSKTVSGQLLNAAPGLFFAIGGFVSIIVTVWKGVSIQFTEEGDSTPAAKTSTGGGGGGGSGPFRRSIAVQAPRRDI